MRESLPWYRAPSLRAALVVAAVFVGDQLSKRAVDRSLAIGAHRRLLHGLQLVDVHNHELVLGFIAVGAQWRLVLGATGLVIAFAVCFRCLAQRQAGDLTWLSLGLMLGGGTGNMFDLLARGSATDFIELSASRIVFNVADAAVTIGIAMLVCLHLARSLRRRPIQRRRLTEARAPTP